MKSSLNIALFHNLPSGGAKRAVYEFTKGLTARGHHIHEFRLSTADSSFLNMVDLTAGETEFPFELPKYKRLPIPGITPFVNAYSTVIMMLHLKQISRRIASYIDSKNFDVVWVNDCRIIYKPFLMRYLRTPFIFYSHHGGTFVGFNEAFEEISTKESKTTFDRVKDIYYWLPTKLPEQIMHHEEIINARDAHYVVTNSFFAAESYYQFFGVPARVVYLGVDHQTFNRSTTERGEYFLSVGSLTYRKGYRFLISVLSLLPLKYRLPLKIIANFVDPKEAEKVESLANKAKVKIEIHQVYNDTELAKIYRQAEVYLSAPILEPFGLTLLEAQACGIPVVAVNEGGLRESVVNGVTGFLVERDPVAFAEALKLLLQDKKLREDMGVKGMEITRSQWNWSKAAASLEWQLQNAIQLNRKVIPE
jgi:glycosyltransferase involved in cell wall biosynthesis